MAKKHDVANPRMAAYDARNEERGIIRVFVRIPEAKRDQLLALCARWRDEAAKK